MTKNTNNAQKKPFRVVFASGRYYGIRISNGGISFRHLRPCYGHFKYIDGVNFKIQKATR